ncbi:MAG: hypothetical protein ACE10D_08150 [Planctomycetota bacterium]|nr:hypothetical protein [Planctomycetota bacterium]
MSKLERALLYPALLIALLCAASTFTPARADGGADVKVWQYEVHDTTLRKTSIQRKMVEKGLDGWTCFDVELKDETAFLFFKKPGS